MKREEFGCALFTEVLITGAAQRPDLAALRTSSPHSQGRSFAGAWPTTLPEMFAKRLLTNVKLKKINWTELHAQINKRCVRKCTHCLCKERKNTRGFFHVSTHHTAHMTAQRFCVLFLDLCGRRLKT